MRFRIKFKTDPRMDKCLREMQELKNYMGELPFVNRLTDKVFEEEPMMTLEESLSILQSFPLVLIDFKNAKLDLNEVKIYNTGKNIVDIFFDRDMWSNMPDGELKDKINYLCEHSKEFIYTGIVDAGELLLPVVAYEDGYLTVEFDMERLPELGLLDEILTQENGSTVVKLTGNSEAFIIDNNVKNDDYLYEFGISSIDVAFRNIAYIIDHAGIDFDKLEDDETVVAETCIVNDSGCKLQDISFKEVVNTETCERCLKLKLPGSKRYYDIELNMNIRNNTLKYRVDIEVDLKTELAEPIKKYFNFIKKSKEFDLGVKEGMELRPQLDALLYDYTPLGCIKNLYKQSHLYLDGADADKIDAVVSEEYNIDKWIRLDKDYIEHIPKIVSCEYNDIHEGVWVFKGVITGWTVADMERFKRIAESRVAKHQIKLNYSKITE